MIHNTYHGGNIETDHHTICYIPGKVTTYLYFLKFTAPGTVILREVIENDTTTIYKVSLNRLGVKKVNLEVYLQFRK